MASVSPELTSEFQEFDTPGAVSQKAVRATRVVESVRLGLTVLSLLIGITILTTSADTLYMFNTTHLGPNFFLPLWPSDFDIRPTIALVVCGSIVLLASTISLIASKTPAIRNKPLAHQSVAFIAPIINLIAGLIGISFFYGVNASDTTYSLHSWTCQWSSVSMDVKPHWGTLCSESKVALYLMIVVIPVQLLVLGTAAFSTLSQKEQPFVHERKGSPALS